MGATSSVVAPELEKEAFVQVNLLRTGDDQQRLDALKILETYSREREFLAPLADRSLGLFEELVKIMSTSSNKTEIKYAVYLIYNVTIEDSIRVYLGGRELGALPLLLKYAPVYESAAYGALNDLALRPENHPYYFARETGILEHFMTVLESNPRHDLEVRLVKMLSSCAGYLQEPCLDLFLSYHPIEAIASRLHQKNNDLEIRKPCLMFVCYVSHFSVASAKLKELGLVPYLTELMDESSVAGLKATVTIANIIGKNEANTQLGSLIERQPKTFEMLLSLLKATLNLGVGEESEQFKAMTDYRYGLIKLRNMCGAFRNLAISDSNKPLMLKTNIVELLLQALSLFVDNVSSLRCATGGGAGGGGGDFETAELALETLLQLSFHYDHDDDLKKDFLSPSMSFDAVKILSECVADERAVLSGEARRNANALLKRLKSIQTIEKASIEVPAVGTSISSSPSSTKNLSIKKQHIMLSYSWSVNKHYVVAFGCRLRELGHDVWRDEEGSNLVGPMQGDTDEKMAAAIEAAHTVVVCVSPQYKESANCRTEAKYSKQRQLVTQLRILYVMMCENYHTRSDPPVDGWLALNIGTDLWYPMWSESMVESAAQSISSVVNGSSGNEGGSVPPSPTKSNTFAAQQGSGTIPFSLGSTVNLDLAWQVLTDPKNAVEPESVVKWMDRMGLSEKEELLDVEDDDMRELAGLLKPLKQKKFLTCLNKHK